MYDPNAKRIIISKEVRFDEKKKWNWDEQVEEDKFVECSEEEEVQEVPPETQNEGTEGAENTGVSNGEEEATAVDTRAEEMKSDASRSRAGRNKQKPVWMRDYVCEDRGIITKEDDGEMMAMFIDLADPVKFEEAVRQDRWRKAMEEEISSIEENDEN